MLREAASIVLMEDAVNGTASSIQDRELPSEDVGIPHNVAA